MRVEIPKIFACLPPHRLHVGFKHAIGSPQCHAANHGGLQFRIMHDGEIHIGQWILIARSDLLYSSNSLRIPYLFHIHIPETNHFLSVFLV